MRELVDAIRGVTLGSVEASVIDAAVEALIANWNDHNDEDQINEVEELKEWKERQGESKILEIIHTEADYKATLAQIDLIFFSEPGTPAGDELDRLVTMVELYEDKNYPLEALERCITQYI